MSSYKTSISKAVLFLTLPAVSIAGSFTLTNTISLPGVDIHNIASDGTHLLVLEPGTFPNAAIGIFTTSGQLLQTYDTGLPLDSLAWNGSSAIGHFAGGGLYQISLPGGPNSGPFGNGSYGSALGLGYDGTSLLVADSYAQGPAGVLTFTLHELNPLTYAETGVESFVINTGTAISGTPIYDFAEQNGNLFVGLQGIEKVYEFSNGNLVQTIDVPTSFGPRGIAIIGNELFVADRENQQIYELSPTPEPGTWAMGLLGGLIFAIVHTVKTWRPE